jgi:hypothetical protein
MNRWIWTNISIGILRRAPGRPARSRFFALRKTRRRGQASLELLIVLLFLIPLLFGAIELSRGVAIRAALDSGVGLAVRALSLDTSLAQWDWAVDKTQDAVDGNVFGNSGVGPLLFGAFDSSGGPLTQPELDALSNGVTFCLRGQVSYSPSIPLMPLSPINIGVEHCGVIERL